MNQKKIRNKLLELCTNINYDGMPDHTKECYEAFPYVIDLEDMSDEFVLGIQEFVTVLSHTYEANGTPHLSEIPCLYASAILYIWWCHNVRDNEFTEVKEIEL